MSKGSSRRPQRVGSDVMADNWMQAFGSKWEARLSSGAVVCCKPTYKQARDYALDNLPEGVKFSVVKV